MESAGNIREEYLRSIVAVLPEKPGVYQYFDRERKLLYVGKAKNLKKRVSSYFSKSPAENKKINVLIGKIAHIEHIVVASESDALLLENNLIKRHQPRYNVLLRDDKTFPWICIKNETFPRVFSTRNIIQDGSAYYGPYTSGIMVKTILELVRQLFPLRNCRLNLSENIIKKGKYKVCLEYHMGNCRGPCIGEENEEAYEKYIEQVHHILKGNIKQVVISLRQLMKSNAASHKYEEAQRLKEKLNIIERYRSKSTIVNPGISNVDVFSIDQEGSFAFVNFLKVVNGAVIQAHTLEIKKKLDEDSKELLSLAIIDIRQKIHSESREILVPERLALSIENVKFTVPQRGDKKHLLELSQRNARYHLIEKKKSQEALRAAKGPSRIMESIQKDLRLKVAPVHIECFDNSNLYGSNPVAACVVFRNAMPSKKEYRHFHIKSVTGADDFASMREVILRRYKRMISEGNKLPQLVVIDGGKGQLKAAVEGLEELKIRGRIAIIGIAKRLEEIYFPGDKIPLYLDKNSETLKIIQQLRNEAHRFGIGLHRNQRSKKMIESEFDAIPGIGPRSKEALLSSFGSLGKVKTADYQEIEKIIGKNKAGVLLRYFLRSTT